MPVRWQRDHPPTIDFPACDSYRLTMATPRIRVLPDAPAVAQAAAEHILHAASAAIADHGSFTIALSGGSTPKQLYELLAEEPYASQLDWAHIEIYFSDERCVPPEAADSNFRLASEALLEAIAIPPGNIHRMRGEIDPQTAAIEYGQMLQNRFVDGGLDLCLLGMGEDGHTASLFPGTTAVGEAHHRCVAVFVERLHAWRITLTAPFLNRSNEVLILVTGPGKARTAQQVLEGPSDPATWPIQLINPPQGQLIWLLDAAAAGM